MIKKTLTTAVIAATLAVSGATLAQADPTPEPAPLALSAPITVPAEVSPLPLQFVASPVEDARALEAFTSYLGTATAVGGFGGTVIGAIIGCAIGSGALAVTVIGIPAGCLAGGAAAAGIGAVVGTIVVGGPTLLISGADLINTLTSAPGTTRWADK